LKRFEFVSGFHPLVPGSTSLFSRTGYTGEDGFEIFCPWDDAAAIWQTFVQWGAVPAGLGARDVLRLEAAYPLYGHELDAEHIPWASGVGWAVKPKKRRFCGPDRSRRAQSIGPAAAISRFAHG
ncbi:MAG: hypothetical protein M3Y28_03040, partial [Armatimonadota bacterium]|nr:hypothetical protein [Armatimonadota bacterium]